MAASGEKSGDLQRLAEVAKSGDHSEFANILQLVVPDAADLSQAVSIKGQEWLLPHFIVSLGMAGAKCLHMLCEACPESVLLLDRDQRTPLHTAAKGLSSKHRSVSEEGMAVGMVLLRHGAEIRAKDCNGQTPVHIAADVGNTGFIAMLHRFDSAIRVIKSPEVRIQESLPPAWDLLLTEDAAGSYPLDLAVRQQKYITVDWLLHLHRDSLDFDTMVKKSLKAAGKVADTVCVKLILDSVIPGDVTGDEMFTEGLAVTKSTATSAFSTKQWQKVVMSAICYIMMRRCSIAHKRQLTLMDAMSSAQRAGLDSPAQIYLAFIALLCRFTLRNWQISVYLMLLSVVQYVWWHAGACIFHGTAAAFLALNADIFHILFSDATTAFSVLLTLLKTTVVLSSAFAALSYLAVRLHATWPLATEPSGSPNSLDNCKAAYTQGISHGVDAAMLQNGYCFHCKIARPPRTCHCTRCGKCTSNFDHHCTWTNCDITLSNHLFFLIFVAACVTASLSWLCAYALYAVNAVFPVRRPLLTGLLAVQLLWMVVFGLVIIRQQYAFLLRGITSHEAKNYRRFGYLKHPETGRYFNPYDRDGAWRNLLRLWQQAALCFDWNGLAAYFRNFGGNEPPRRQEARSSPVSRRLNWWSAFSIGIKTPLGGSDVPVRPSAGAEPPMLPV